MRLRGSPRLIFQGPIAPAVVLGILAQLLFTFRVTTPTLLVFDEVHYVPAARTLLGLAGPANTEHPLFGKTLIALGIALFGDGPLGWRVMSTVAGTATLLAVYAIAWLLSGRVRTAVLAGVLALGNFTLFVQARIAMLDGFMAALALGGLACLLWAAEAPSKGAAWWRWLTGAALLGLATATKWTALPLIGFAGLGLVAVRLREAARAGRPLATVPRGALRGDGRYWRGLATVPALAVLGIVAGLAYLLTFLPAFFYAQEPLTPATLLPFQHEMWARQTQVLPAHTYQSRPWTWPLLIRPIWYLYEPVDGVQRGILLLGNPVVMWGGLAAVAALLWAGLRERRWRLLAPALLWLGSWGMWLAIPKSLGFFYYYYLPSLVLPIAIAVAGERWAHGRRAGWDAAFAGAAVVLFVWFYPILAAMPLGGPGAFQRWTWFDSWV